MRERNATAARAMRLLPDYANAHQITKARVPHSRTCCRTARSNRAALATTQVNVRNRRLNALAHEQRHKAWTVTVEAGMTIGVPWPPAPDDSDTRQIR